MTQKIEVKIGDKFGDYTIISQPYKYRKFWKVKCKCICGKVLTKYCGNLKRITRCKVCAAKKKYHIYGKGTKKYNLTVIEYIQKKSKRLLIKVQCDCGQTRIIQASLFGVTKTCGCIRFKQGKNHPSYKGLGYISGTYFSQVKLNATKKNLDFNITLKYLNNLLIKQKHKCILSGLDIIIGSTIQETTASLDRIDSNKGYTRGNVQWVHKDINHLKSDFSLADFKKLCRLVSKYSR
jgi:hypothetical protein